MVSCQYYAIGDLFMCSFEEQDDVLIVFNPATKTGGRVVKITVEAGVTYYDVEVISEKCKFHVIPHIHEDFIQEFNPEADDRFNEQEEYFGFLHRVALFIGRPELWDKFKKFLTRPAGDLQPPEYTDADVEHYHARMFEDDGYEYSYDYEENEARSRLDEATKP
jgi:hypothetical protein